MSATKKFGTAPVFFTAISTILGAILFLRFGYAVGTLGYLGVALIIILGHMVTIPTALAISEIATNHKVEGGGEYFIISRSFGLNIGATIGIALYLSQAISVAFYVIAFTEAFEPLFNFVQTNYGWNLPKQVISIPVTILLAILILKKGASIGLKTLYWVVAILVICLVMFFLGDKTDPGLVTDSIFTARNLKTDFFIVFAICFPAFTGMTAGVGLSGDLKSPAKSIPRGSILATVSGMIIYFFIAFKLNISTSPENLVNNQLVMGDIALWGNIIVPLGLAASTISSAIGSILVAPRTLQALGSDQSVPLKPLNRFFSKGVGESNEPYNATIVTSAIALIFVFMGDVDGVATVISMFFMVTYGSLCLISFLYHFGADPSYRPAFKSRWYISLIGFLMCIWLMFRIDGLYAVVAIILMVLLYMLISRIHKNRNGMQEIFQSALFQLSRNIQITIQRKKDDQISKWKPAAVCISSKTTENNKAYNLLEWISEKHGFGTYIYLIDGYFSHETNKEASEIMEDLIKHTNEKSKVYLDTLISPSYTSAIVQMIQIPGVSGMENNLVLFEFNKEKPEKIQQIKENIALIKSASKDIMVLSQTNNPIKFKNGIHIWLKATDFENSNLMILLSYILLGSNDWKKGDIKIFEICNEQEVDQKKKELLELVQIGRLPISPQNIELIKLEQNINPKSLINTYSKDAGLTLIGFREEQLKHQADLFTGYDEIGDILFVNARSQIKI